VHEIAHQGFAVLDHNSNLLKNRAILPEKTRFIRPVSPPFAEFWQPNGSQSARNFHRGDNAPSRPFDLIFQRAKSKEWRARRDSNSQPE